MREDIRSPWFVWFAVYALANLVIIFAFQPFVFNADSQGYVETGNFLLGMPGGVFHFERALKPLGPVGAVLLGSLFSQDASRGLLIENALYYLLSIPVIFAFLYRAHRHGRTAFWGSVLYISAYPVLAYSVTYMTDMSGWFFLMVSSYYVLRWYDEGRVTDALLAGVSIGVGFLFKEYTASAGVFFVILAWYKTRQYKEWMRAVAVVALSAGVIVLAWQGYMYRQYAVSFADWYRIGGVSRYTLHDVPFIIKSIIGVFLLGWVYALKGAKRIIQERHSRLLPILHAMIPASFLFLLWHVASSRIYFISGGLVALTAAYYMEHMYVHRPRLARMMFVMILGVNYAWFVYGDGIRPLIWPWIQS